MNFSSIWARPLRSAAPPLLALLLTVALAGSALAQQPPNSPGGPPSGPGPGLPSTNPPGNPPASPPVNPPGSEGPLGAPPSQTPSDPNTNPMPDPDPDPQPDAPFSPLAPHPDAPFSPPADCIVAHAATPAQLCPMAGGLQYYFIGADGSAQPGPWIQPFSELAALASWSIYSGTNTRTGKSVTITYIASENRIRVSTFYPDNEYDTNKPYAFTVDSNHNVTHEAW